MMLLRPPSSTLFPYTTLFRSVFHGLLHYLLWLPESNGYPLLHECQDRKSTRLNSSHDQISYAVFCLKKKNHVFSYTVLVQLIQLLLVRMFSTLSIRYPCDAIV